MLPAFGQSDAITMARATESTKPTKGLLCFLWLIRAGCTYARYGARHASGVAGGVVVSFATVYVIGLATVLLIGGTALIVDGIRRFVNAGIQTWKATRPLPSGQPRGNLMSWHRKERSRATLNPLSFDETA